MRPLSHQALSYLLWGVLLFAILCAELADAQKGDRPGEHQAPPSPDLVIPPAPVLSPEEALKSFTLAPGFRLEVVAAEPLVQDPVAAVFDPDGRLWVVEMHSFMPNVDGEGESTPDAQIVTLTDTDGDGRMDQRTIFLDALVLPRAMAFAADGVLVAEPPNLWFCRDLNGDGTADEQIIVATDYGLYGNPEHKSNGLLWALDNWNYSAKHATRYRVSQGKFVQEATAFRGQWGITQDDYGRLFYNTNSNQLRGDLVPSHYLKRNPHYANPTGVNVQIAADQSVWPIRVTPGVNRGYRKGFLRDGKLKKFTAACAPLIYRGDRFPAEFKGSAFVCEPAAHLIRCNRLTEANGTITAVNFYDRAEFLASTDERFRPVNLLPGPDGALYIVDMYRGLIQHRVYVTTFLRRQVLERGLDHPTGLGRIYRIVHESRRAGNRKPGLARASSAALVKRLKHPRGWWRDTAQRLLVERGDRSVVPALKKLVRRGPTDVSRIHALWTLEGLESLDRATTLAALADPDSKVRAAAIRLLEPWLKSEGSDEVLSQLLKVVSDSRPDVRLQLALTLGESRKPEAEAVQAALLKVDASSEYLRDAVLTGLKDRELEFLERILAGEGWIRYKTGREHILGGLARCVTEEGITPRIDRLLTLAEAQPKSSWRRWSLRLLEGISPTAGAALKEGQPLLGSAYRLKGVTATKTPEKVTPLTALERTRLKQGKTFYFQYCVSCHRPRGRGQEGLAPPLINSEWVLGPKGRLVRIVLHGVAGPITVNGAPYDMEMPGHPTLDDETIAAILTYIRQAWGHTASPVTLATVAKVRASTQERKDTWTAEELFHIK